MITLSKKMSQNAKLGWGVFTTYRRVGETCPVDCKALVSGACYALGGNVGIHQRKSAQDVTDGQRLKEWLGGLPRGVKVRHHVSGDFMRDGVVDVDYVKDMKEGHKSRKDLQGWVYTHAWRDLSASEINDTEGLTVNASCDSVPDLIEALERGWLATLIVDEHAENFKLDNGVRVVICPNQTHDVTCSDCMLCFRKIRKTVVGFRLHGSGKAKW
jgi:hypothetical protein